MNSISNFLYVVLVLCLGLPAYDSRADDNGIASEHGALAIPPIIVPAALSLIAGNTDGPGSTDGVGLKAQFGDAYSDMGEHPMGITSDAEGNLYVADESNHTIRKVSAEGVVTTIAGKAGIPGSTDGAGTDARFNYPTGIAMDKAGNLYVTDSANHTIRKITPAGVVSTLAGKAGVAGPPQDGIGEITRFQHPEGITVDSKGVIYVTDTFNNAVRQIDSDGLVTTLTGASAKRGFIEGALSDATFSQPDGIAVDPFGGMYIVDKGNRAIRIINRKRNYVVAMLGYSADIDGPQALASISHPIGLGIDETGIYVTTDHGIRKIGRDAVVSTVAGQDSNGHTDGIGKAASFSMPSGVTADKLGNLYLADDGLIRKINPKGTVTTLAGRVKRYGFADGVGRNALFNDLMELAKDKLGNIYVTDRGNNVIRKISANGVVTTLAGLPGQEGIGYADGVGRSARFDGVNGIAVDGTGDVYVSDTGNQVIRKINPYGKVTTIAGTVKKKGNIDGIGRRAHFNQPAEMISDTVGNLYVVDSVESIRKIDRAGIVTTLAGKTGEKGNIDGNGREARFSQIGGMTADIAGNLYVIDDDMIRKISSSGTVSTLGHYAETIGYDYYSPISKNYNGSITFRPEAIVADEMGNLYYSVHSTIRKMNAQGIVIAEFDASSPELGALRALRNPYCLIFLDHRTLAMLTGSAVLAGDAVLKMTLP
jgi:streptogramin lyase